MNFGIDKISFYTSNYYVDLKTLALARNVDPAKFYDDFGQKKMAIAPPNEDTITLAANATWHLLQNEDTSNIEMVLFATESAIDQSKAAATYIHKWFNLPSRCRVIELKQACYSATFGLQMVMAWLRQNPTKRVLLIAADIAHYEFNTAAESSQGCGAVAMLLSANPHLLEIEPISGFCTKETMDFWKPNYFQTALVNGRLSCETDMRLAEESWKQYAELTKRKFIDFDRFCYHTPIAKMVEITHKKIAKLNKLNLTSEQLAHQLESSLIYTREVGNCYTASLYLSVLSLLENANTTLANKLIGLYSYGSGSIGEFFAARVITNYKTNMLVNQHHQKMLNARQEIPVKTYEEFYTFKTPTTSEKLIPQLWQTGKFRLKGFNQHQRIYEKSRLTTTKPQENITITSRAPGKIILSGEHAVIYAKPALAMAVDRFAETTISRSNENKFQFEWINEKTIKKTTLPELKHLQIVVDTRYQNFIHGKCKIKNVIHEPLELLQYAFIYLVENLSLPIKNDLKIQVQLNLPTGCGMGTSAAVILSLMHALINYFGISLAIDKYLSLGREIENLQHGKSSGLDLFLSLHGGCHFFNDLVTQKRPIPNIPLTLINTGKPKTSTGECVETTIKYFQNSTIADDFAAITIAMDLALQQNNLPALQECICENHQLLKAIGVVPNKVDQFVAAIEARGNAAKISGAGAASGDTAGIVLATGTASISDLVEEYGYEILSVRGEPSGLQII